MTVDYTSKEFWKNAPEGATHYAPKRSISIDYWMKSECGKRFYWSLNNSWERDLTIDDPSRYIPRPNFGHPHADLMAQYAEDAKETDKPWEWWERKIGPTGEWTSLGGNHPLWNADYQYRRKPKTRTAEEILGEMVSRADAHRELSGLIAEARELLKEKNSEKP